MLKPIINTFSTIVNSTKFDSKGRKIGFEVALQDRDDGVYWAAVQQVRDGEHFGVVQRCKPFDSQESASRWAYKEAKNRILNLK